MTQLSTFQCDGPACLEIIEEPGDEDDLIEAGWLVVTFVADEDERTAHLHTYACLVSWAAEGAAEEAG